MAERVGAISPDDVKRLKRLQGENSRLKKILAERDLGIDVIKEIASKNEEHVPPEHKCVMQ